MGTVEVLRDPKSKTWYCGQIVDIGNKDGITVAFGDYFPKASFPSSRVRKVPRIDPATLDRFNPKVGDQVELKLEATEKTPPGWATATVKQIKHDFYFVRQADGQSDAEAIVEKDKLRPPTDSSHAIPSGLEQDTYKLPQNLQAWANTDDAAGCFRHIEEQAQLAFLRVLPNSLKLFGESRSIQTAKMLLEVHLKHQTKIQDFQDQRERGLRALETRRSRIEGAGYKHSADIELDASFIPKIIGRKGEAIRALSDKYDVLIRILDDEEEEHSETRRVRIFGHTAESIEKTKAEIEFVEEAIAVEPDTYTWLLGPGGRTINGFRDSCGLQYAKLDRTKQQLLLCGSKTGVQEATAMFVSHLMYYDVFRQMDDDMADILNQLEEYGDYNPRWEWNWFREEEPEVIVGTNGEPKGDNGQTGKGKGKGKGKKGSRQDQDKENYKESNDNKSKVNNKEKEKEKPKQKEKEQEKEQASTVSSSQKGGATKGSGSTPIVEKAGKGKGKRGVAKEKEAESSEEDAYEGKGRGGKAKGKQQPRWQKVEQEDEEEESEEEAPAGGGRSRKGGGKASQGGSKSQTAAQGKGSSGGGRKGGKKGGK
mmetsp:Transcript_29200/g.63372  ORF Transcript_29200/g.63372 Transcript_29200/m.63372 type:complete len:594 (+) Transcript_29200:36-1817(+)